MEKFKITTPLGEEYVYDNGVVNNLATIDSDSCLVDGDGVIAENIRKEDFLIWLLTAAGFEIEANEA